MKTNNILSMPGKMILSETGNLSMMRFANLPAVILMLIVLAGAVIAQSIDPDKPAPMTTNEVKGRWPGGKAVSYYYSFEAGPGEMMIMFDFTPDRELQNVVAELTDVYGRGISNLDDSQGRSELSYFATTKSLRLVGRYQIRSRQKLVVKVASVGDDDVIPGAYKIRVEGGNPSFGQSVEASANQAGLAGKSTEKRMAESDRAACLPKSGTLSLVMSDGTVREINLSRVREASIKP